MSGLISSITTINAILIKIPGLDDLILPLTSHVFNSVDDSAYAEVQASNDQKYYIKSATGLEPPGRNIAIAATAAGGKFQGVTTEDREVVILIGLEPDWDAGETPKMLRDRLYHMVYTGYNPRFDVQLLSFGTIPVAHEYGYIEKFEAAIFDPNPAVQLTIKMLNPTFRSYLTTEYDPAELSEHTPNVFNEGSAETGFMFGVKFTDDKSNWYIKTAEDQSIGMNFIHDFNDGDILTVSTVPGNKYVHLKKHRGKVKNAMGILQNGSEWIQLHPGNNHFVVAPKASKWDWKGKLSFVPHYAGV